MKKYLFYTTGGYTQDENNESVENCQMLGFSCGNDEESAYNNFVKENDFLQRYKFSTITAVEITVEPVTLF